MRVFGSIDGVRPGTEFEDRKALAKSGVHKPLQAGISGSQLEGADSIVLSGGYEDDEDFGDVIIYTGAGGQDSKKRQTSDQTLTASNLALAKSKIDKLPVRVTRGYQHVSEFSPDTGYKYTGLYYVDDYWPEEGKSGFIVWRFRLVSESNSIPDQFILEPPEDYESTSRKSFSNKRIIRDHQKALNVKRWHNYKCQVCGLAIQTSAGPYAEAAHIKPLGEPHNGPDSEHNILCLCPNHHVMFDNGGFTIAKDLSLIGIEGTLRTTRLHKIDKQFITYHRAHYLNSKKCS